jgi:hypothetical protein
VHLRVALLGGDPGRLLPYAPVAREARFSKRRALALAGDLPAHPYGHLVADFQSQLPGGELARFLNPGLRSLRPTESDQRTLLGCGNPIGEIDTIITMIVPPYPAFTSTSTGYAWMPFTAAEQTLANLRKSCRRRGQRAIRFIRKFLGSVRDQPCDSTRVL